MISIKFPNLTNNSKNKILNRLKINVFPINIRFSYNTSSTDTQPINQEKIRKTAEIYKFSSENIINSQNNELKKIVYRCFNNIVNPYKKYIKILNTAGKYFYTLEGYEKKIYYYKILKAQAKNLLNIQTQLNLFSKETKHILIYESPSQVGKKLLSNFTHSLKKFIENGS